MRTPKSSSRREEEGNNEGSSDNHDGDDDQTIVYKGKNIIKRQHNKIPTTVSHATIHPSVRKIEEFAFQDCTNLVNVSIPKTVQQIHQFAFKGCTSLKTLCLEEGLKSIERGAFEGCKSLVGTSPSASSLDDTFAGTPSLSIPSTVEKIAWYAFSGNISLAKVQFHQGLRHIERGAFLSCESLVTVDLPIGLKTIGEEAFCWCESLESVSVPSTVKLLGGEAFAGCKSLKDVHLQEGLKTIGERAFGWCRSLVDMKLPQTVETVEFFAFGFCVSLANLHIPEGLISIGQSAFASCTALYAIALPSSLEELCLKAFSDCANLRTVEFPREETRLAIGNHCFHGCKALVNVSLPTSIGGTANTVFAGCDLLQGVDDSLVIHQRFAHLPVHDACYHSSTTTATTTIPVSANGELIDSALEDAFGMTPFHILATSAYPSVSILKCLLEQYPVEVLEHKDMFDKTMLDYLLLHTSDKAVSLIQTVLERAIVDKLCSRCTGNKWRSELKVCLEALQNGQGVESRRNHVHECFFGSVGYCIRLEATSTIELALWKMRTRENVVEEDTFREDCRFQCGSDVVVENVAVYLWNGVSRSDTAMSTFRI